jgi:hypothetical protein
MAFSRVEIINASQRISTPVFSAVDFGSECFGDGV